MVENSDLGEVNGKHMKSDGVRSKSARAVVIPGPGPAHIISKGGWPRRSANRNQGGEHKGDGFGRETHHGE